MINAKTELLEILNGAVIKCAQLEVYEGFNPPVVNLPEKHSSEDLENFYERLNVQYDNRYRGGLVSGIVWLQDGTWLERAEYDGSEWWEHKFLPEIPKELKAKEQP